MNVAPGSTSVSITVEVVDDSGIPVTGLVAATLPTIYYATERAASTSITLADLAAITSSYSSGGVKERAGSAGKYRLDVPNAAFASATRLTIYGESSGKRVIPVRVDVRYETVGTPDTGDGKTLVTSGTGTGQISLSGGVANANATQWAGTAILAASLPVTRKAGNSEGLPVLHRTGYTSVAADAAVGSTAVVIDSASAPPIRPGMSLQFEGDGDQGDAAYVIRSYADNGDGTGTITLVDPLRTAGVTFEATPAVVERGMMDAASQSSVDTAQAGLDTLTTRLTAARAGYLDNLNVGGAVASHADVAAVNQSAAKHLLLQTVAQYERPESGSTTYTVECRTFAADTGAATDADATPTLTATGQTTGSLSANVGTATHPATGVYRWAYTVANDATLEPVRFDVAATIATAAFTLSCYTQVCDFVAATFTTSDRTNLQNIADALPAGGIADEANAGTRQTALLAALGTPMQAGDQVDLVDAPNATAVAAIQEGLSTFDPDTDNVTVGGYATGQDPATLTFAHAAWGAFAAKFSGLTSLIKVVACLFRKSGNDATALNELNADFGGGAGTADPTTDSGEAIRDRGDAAWVTGAGGGGPSGAGAYTLTVTVTDGTDPLQNATVRYSEGASSYTATTDASGVATFALDAATYDVAITKAGYAFTPTTHAVSATGSKAWAMTAVAIPAAASPDQTNAYLTTYDGKGAVLGGVTLTFRLVDPGTGAGYSYPKTEFTAVSDTDTGLLTVSLAVSTQYQAKRGEGDWVSFTTGSDATYQLPEVLSAEWS